VGKQILSEICGRTNQQQPRTKRGREINLVEIEGTNKKINRKGVKSKRNQLGKSEKLKEIEKEISGKTNPERNLWEIESAATRTK